MYMTTPISVFMSGPKKGQKWYRQTHGAMDLKHGMHTQLHFGSSMGGISPVANLSCVQIQDCVNFSEYLFVMLLLSYGNFLGENLHMMFDLAQL